MQTADNKKWILLSVCALLFAPGLLRSQMPSRPGRLSIDSIPQGATVAIDKRQMQRTTPFTWVVPPGQHTVSVNGKDQAGKEISCTASLYVSSGVTKSLRCTLKGWDPPLR